MICPGCGTEDQIAYSVLSSGLICLEPGCDFEIEMSTEDAHKVMEPSEELVCV